MTLDTSPFAAFLTLLVLPFLIVRSYSFEINASIIFAPKFSTKDKVLMALNLEYLEAEYFLYGATGKGLDAFAPTLTGGGPPPIGAKKANLDPFIRSIIYQFGLQEVGHIRAIKKEVGGFSRPLLNISSEVFGDIMNEVIGRRLRPPFDPYKNSLNFLITTFLIPYLGLTGYVGTIAESQDANPPTRKLLGGLLGVESGQDAVVRTLLYERKNMEVAPYGITVAEFTDRISELKNKLGKAGTKDEGLTVPKSEGAEGQVSDNILAGDNDSLSYGRTPVEVLRIIYGNGDEHVPAGVYPKGAKGRIADYYAKRAK